MRRAFLPASLFLLVSLLGCGDALVVVGDRLPLQLPTADGGAFDGDRVAGRVVLLELWASWCTPCLVQGRILAGMAPELAERGVEVLSVNYGESPALVREHLERSPQPFTVLLDEDTALADSVGIVAIPAVLVVDRRGRLSAVREGLASAEEIRRLVRGALDAGT